MRKNPLMRVNGTGVLMTDDFVNMDWIDRKQIGEELLNNMDLTKEQYLEAVRLAEEMDLMYEFGYKLPDDIDVEPEKEENNGK